jgi:hypothetical protein
MEGFAVTAQLSQTSYRRAAAHPIVRGVGAPTDCLVLPDPDRTDRG